MSQRKPRRRNRSRRPSGSKTDEKTLYVGVMNSKFPNYITSKHLQQHFGEFEADITSTMIMRDSETKESKGHGFVSFSSHEAAEAARQKLKGSMLRDKFPVFMKYKKSDSSEALPARHRSSQLFFRAMKSKLPDYINNTHIRSHFAEFEEDIVSTVVVYDKETKQSKGFGFITFTSDRAAMEAKRRMHGSTLLGEFPLYVNLRKPSASSSLASSIAGNADESDEESLPESDIFESSESESEDSTIADNRTLYVGVWKSKFPNVVNTGHLKDHFSDFDDHIVSARIVRDPESHLTKGYGFVTFTTSEVAGKAMKKLRGSKLLDKYPLYINYQKPALPGRSRSSSVMSDVSTTSAGPTPSTASTATKGLQELMPCSKTYQLRPGAVSLAGLQTTFKQMESKHFTRIVKQTGQAVVIYGFNLEDVERSWEGVREYIELNLTVMKTVPVSCGCVKLLQKKPANYLRELRKQCEIRLPPTPVSGKAVSVTLKGKMKSTKDVFDKLKKFSSKCHTDSFEMQCPKHCTRFWKNRWDRLSNDLDKSPSILIDFTVSQSPKPHPGTNSQKVTVTVVGTDPGAIKALKAKVLENENCSGMTKQVFKLPSEDFETVSDNLEELQLELEKKHSTVLSLEKETEMVQLEAPFSLGGNLHSAKKEVLTFVDTCSSIGSNTIVMEHTFEDVVVGLLLTGKPQYHDEIKKEAAKRSVMVQVQKKPKVGLQLRGNRKDVQAVKQKIASLSLTVDGNIEHTQTIVSTSSHLLLTTDAFAKFHEKLQEDTFVSVSYPKQAGLLRQLLLQTSSGYVITLQLCVGDLDTEEADAIVLNPNQVHKLAHPSVQREFRQYVQQHGYPEGGSAICHGSGSLNCRNVIIAPVPDLKEKDSSESAELLLATYHSSLACADSKGMGSVSFPLLGVSEIEWNVATIFLAVDMLPTMHPNTFIHNVRIVVKPTSSTACVPICDEMSTKLKHAKFHRMLSPPSRKSSLSLSPPPSLSLVKWQWRDDKKSFTSYPQNIAEKLTKTRNSNPNGKCYFKINKSDYVVDLSTMTQTNVHTGYVREVKCVTTASSTGEVASGSTQRSTPVQWYYMDDSKVLTPYSEVDSGHIERMYSGASKSTFLTISGRGYIFNFVTMKQINSSTRHSRSIERKVIATHTPVKEAPEESPLLSSSNKKELVITIRGPRENLAQAKRKLEMKLKELLYAADVPLPAGVSNHLEQKLHVIISKHSVDYSVKQEAGANVHVSSQKRRKVLEIKGPESAVHKAVTEVQAEIINFHSETPSALTAALVYPPEWEPQTKTTELFELSRFSEERRKVATNLRETLPRAQISSIKRIQNKWLWERYEQNKRRLSEKNAGMVNEKELYHGSRTSCAEAIYDSEEGFDSRFSSQGMWGRASYFAVKASYSDSYAYSLPDGSKEILLAKVLTGDSYSSPPSRDLKMPPEKSAASGSKVQLKQVRYDTVNGVTNGSQVFMTYSNDKAYPAYLIVYSTTYTTQDVLSMPSHPRPVRPAPVLPPRSRHPPTTTSATSQGVVQSAYQYFQQMFKKT